jgi:hypothetical protein
MREHAVILTYPGHFHLTQLTIRSVREHIQPKDITVIVDDWSFLTWDGYVNDCKQAYNGCNVINTLQFEFLKPFEGDSWMRQQMVKLNLHKILPFDKWFFSDGDIQFFHDIPEDVTPWVIVTIPMDIWENWNNAPLADKGTLLMANYVNSMLGLTNFWELPADYKKASPNKVVATSAIPFRDMNKQILNDLEEFLVSRFNQDLVGIHVDVMKDPTKAMSEWELIEAFKKYIKHDDLTMVHITPQDIDTIKHHKYPDDLYFLMHFLHDEELGADWFADQGIKINDEIWQKIPKKRY